MTNTPDPALAAVLDVKPIAETKETYTAPLNININPQTTNRIPKIAIYVPSRGRPTQAVATLMSWQALAQDPTNIQFVVGADRDDIATQQIKGENLSVYVFNDSVASCGERVKILAENIEADIYLAVVDYYFACTQGWDNMLRNVMQNEEVVNLLFAPEPMSFNLTACSKKWMSLANPLEPCWFPFWFSDQWRLEMSCYVFNRTPTMYAQIASGGRHGRSMHLYELDFWWGFFHALRPLRLRQAYEIAKAYGYATPTFEEFVGTRQKHINNFMMVDMYKKKDLPQLEQMFGTHGAPSKKYLECKRRAEQTIQEMGLELWKMKSLVQ